MIEAEPAPPWRVHRVPHQPADQEVVRDDHLVPHLVPRHRPGELGEEIQEVVGTVGPLSQPPLDAATQD